MYIDGLLRFSNAQAITAAAASTDYLDLGVAREVGAGQKLFIAISVDVAFTDGSSDSTLTVSAYYDSTTSFTPDASEVLCIIPALSAIGYKRLIPLPILSAGYQYMQLYYSPNNGNLTTGSVSASIVLNGDLQQYYDSGFSIQ